MHLKVILNNNFKIQLDTSHFLTKRPLGPQKHFCALYALPHCEQKQELVQSSNMYNTHQYVPITTFFFSAMLAVKEIAGSEKLVGEASRRENNMRKSINSQVGILLSSPCVQALLLREQGDERLGLTRSYNALGLQISS